MSAHFESAISRLRLTSERRARTTVILATAPNGTSGAPADGKHAPPSGDLGNAANRRSVAREVTPLAR